MRDPVSCIILESTTYPGTTAEVLGPIFAERGLIPGRDIFLAFSPEREDPGNPDYHTTTIPKDRGWPGPLRPRPRRFVLPQLHQDGRPRLVSEHRRSREVDREHFPGRQYRARQRIEESSIPRWVSTSGK